VRRTFLLLSVLAAATCTSRVTTADKHVAPAATPSVAPGAAAPQTAPQDGRADPAVIADLVLANHILGQQGIFDGFGHVSVRHARNPNRYLLSRSLAPELVTADDIVELDLESKGLNDGGRAMYLERFIHGAIYKARPEVNAIVHSHSPALVPFSVSSVPLRPVSHTAGFITDGVPIFDIRKASGITDMLVSDADRASRLAATLGTQPAALMRGHGVVVVGTSLPIAVGRSIYLELNAKLQTQAIALGGTMTYLDPQEARRVMAAGENGGYLRAWDLWKKKAASR
jgi:ribulose-5-phosphate 4-epimerase/fuculose-1-phosphate aldolase